MNAIIAKFPHKTPSRMTGEPAYQSITDLLLSLYDNAASIAFPLGGGKHGHVGLLMTPTLYATLSATKYVDPKDPGVAPTFPTKLTVSEKATIETEHSRDQKIFDTHTDVSDAIKQQIIDAVDTPFLRAIKVPLTGFMSVSPRSIIKHLMDRYGRITTADLQQNLIRINEAMDATQPIDISFKKIDDCVQYADAGKTPFTPAQILLIAYNALYSAGIFQ